MTMRAPSGKRPVLCVRRRTGEGDNVADVPRESGGRGVDDGGGRSVVRR